MGKIYSAVNKASFATGDSPLVYDLNTLLGRPANQGFVHNYGSGTLTVALSQDGVTYGDEITMVSGDTIGFGGGTRQLEAVIPFQKIRFTWVSDTSFKYFLY